jgi:hypothetical protein
MNAITAKPTVTDSNDESISHPLTPDWLSPDWLSPDRELESHVERPRSLPSVLAAICEDCSKNSMQYVLRCDTGHDGE